MAVLAVDEAIPKTAYGFEYRWLSLSRFAELAPQVLDVLANPYRADQVLLVADHRGDLRRGDHARGLGEQVLDEFELARCQADCLTRYVHLMCLHVEFDRPVLKDRG
ncbi:MAG: hypothetical protein K0R13_2674 [Propionibacteriaceae bacterium]|nr:hypothetical protein [Propionibacteriaceae bacterium]